MKKILALILSLIMMVCIFSGCANTGAAEDDTAADNANVSDEPSIDDAETDKPAEPEIELVVFAAASMTETLTRIAELYKEAAPNVTLTYNFDSSGTLKTQIQEGADCDVFISAAQKQMNQLDITADPEINSEGLDFVLKDSRIDLLENKVTLCVPEGNEANINSFEDMQAALSDGTILMAMGNADVPVGAYTQKILTYFGLNEEALASAGLLTYGSNVKEVTSQISEAAVDCGVIYQTDAYSAGLTIVDTATSEMCGQVVYPAAVLNVSEQQEAAQAFINFLSTAECSAIFEEVGFTALSK